MSAVLFLLALSVAHLVSAQTPYDLLLQGGHVIDGSLSSDLHVTSMNAGMKDMTNIMSKFLALGMPLKDVVVRSTWDPAKEIKLEQLGNLSVGAPADIAVLRLEKGKFGFLDQRGGRLDGTQKLGCELTVREGAVVYDLNGIAAEAWEKMAPAPPRRPAPAPPQ